MAARQTGVIGGGGGDGGGVPCLPLSFKALPSPPSLSSLLLFEDSELVELPLDFSEQVDEAGEEHAVVAEEGDSIDGSRGPAGDCP